MKRQKIQRVGWDISSRARYKRPEPLHQVRASTFMDLSKHRLYREAKDNRRKLGEAMALLQEAAAVLQRDIDVADNCVEITKRAANEAYATAVHGNPCAEIPLGESQFCVLPPPMSAEESASLVVDAYFSRVRRYADTYRDIWPHLHKSAAGMDALRAYVMGRMTLEDAGWAAYCDLVYTNSPKI